MEIGQEINVLDQNHTRIDFRKYPRAIRSGLAPSDVEMGAVNDASRLLNEHLASHPYTSLGELVHDSEDLQRIKFSLNGGWVGIV